MGENLTCQVIRSCLTSEIVVPKVSRENCCDVDRTTLVFLSSEVEFLPQDNIRLSDFDGPFRES